MVEAVMGFGFGWRNPKARAVRLGLLALVLVAGLLFHGHGRSYESVRALYYVVILGFVFLRLSGRSGRRGASGGGFGGPRGFGWPGRTGAPPSFGDPDEGRAGFGAPGFGLPSGPEPGEPGPPGDVASGSRPTSRWAPPEPGVPPVDPPLGSSPREG